MMQTFSRKSPILLSTNSSLFAESEMVESDDDEKETYYYKKGKRRNGNLNDDNLIFHSFKSQKKRQNKTQINREYFEVGEFQVNLQIMVIIKC